jgi:hypothetical protein
MCTMTLYGGLVNVLSSFQHTRYVHSSYLVCLCIARVLAVASTCAPSIVCVPDSFVGLWCECEPGLEAEAAVQAAERKMKGDMPPAGHQLRWP